MLQSRASRTDDDAEHIAAMLVHLFNAHSEGLGVDSFAVPANICSEDFPVAVQ